MTWAAAMVGEGRDLNLLSRQKAIEDRVGKTRQIYAPDTAWVNQSPRIGPIDRQVDYAFELCNEGGTQARVFFLKEQDCFKVFSLRVRGEAVSHFNSARAFLATSSPGTHGCRPSSICAARRADSSPHNRSNSGSETSSKLNKSRCARFARSSTGRDRASASIWEMFMTEF